MGHLMVTAAVLLVNVAVLFDGNIEKLATTAAVAALITLAESGFSLVASSFLR